MDLHLDLDAVNVRLTDPEDLSRFQVRVDAPIGATAESHSHRLGDVVAARHLGALEDSGDVVVDLEVVRFLAAGEVGDDYDEKLAGMVAYADAHGWVDGHGRVRAHVIWPGPPAGT